MHEVTDRSVVEIIRTLETGTDILGLQKIESLVTLKYKVALSATYFSKYCGYFFFFSVFCSKSVNIMSCDVVSENNIEHCQVSVIQDFVHVGQQTVHISINSYVNNLTIHSQMLIFHGVIAGECICVILCSTMVHMIVSNKL